MPQEARLEDNGAGLVPTSEGWFVVNARDTAWVVSESFGAYACQPGSSLDHEGKPGRREPANTGRPVVRW